MKKMTKKQIIAVLGIGVLLIGGVTFAIVKHNGAGGVKTALSSSKSSQKMEKSSKSTLATESQQESTSQQESSSQKETTQASIAVDTKNLTENQFKQWVAITQSNQMNDDNHPIRITVSKNDSGSFQAILNYTSVHIDSANTYRVNSSGELEAVDPEHYPGMKVVSQSFPEINQNQLTKNQVNMWVVAVQDALLEKSGTNPALDIFYDLETSTDGNLVNVKVFKINYSPSANGGAADANRELMNEFRISSSGNLEMKEINSDNYNIISTVYMDTSMVQ